MGKCSECAHENVPFYEAPCYWCLRLNESGLPTFDKFEPKEKKENEKMEICNKCVHRMVPFYKDPCCTCLRHLDEHSILYDKFEPRSDSSQVEEKKEPEQEETKKPEPYCTNCKHIDVSATEEPCLSCWGFNKFEPKEDKVNHPSHYTTGEIEVINYIRDKLGCQEFTGYCIGNVMKYISRWRHKDGAQDLEKAKVYLQWAIESAHKEDLEKTKVYLQWAIESAHKEESEV